MLILHIVTDLGPGGAELMLKRLVAHHRRQHRHEHVVISLMGKAAVGPQLEELGVSVEALEIRGLRSIPVGLWKLVRIIRRLKPDIVQTWLYASDLLGGLAARLAGRRRIIWGVRATHITPGFGTSRITPWVRRVCAFTSRWIPARIVYVANAARNVHEALGYSRDRGSVIPNGYDVPPRPKGEEKRARRRSQGLPEEALLIGTAGRFNNLKDYPNFIAAAAIVAQRRPEARFVMLGRGLEPSNEQLTQWIAATGYSERFHLLGHKDNLADYLASLDIFCLHSISEGFPNVVAEAMSLAVPCVVTDAGDAASLVADTGLVVPIQRADLLASALEEMCAESEQVRADRGGRARARVEAHYSMESVANMYGRLYLDLLEQS